MIDIFSTFYEYKINKKNYKRYFIGESIIPHNSEINKYDLIATNHWDDREKAYEKAKLIKNLRNKLIPEISQKLNEVHNINLSSTSWNLIIGNWFNQFSGVIIDRLLSIELILKYNNNFNFYINKDWNIEDLIPNDTKEAQDQFTEDDLWNNSFYGLLIKEINKIKGKTNIKICTYNVEKLEQFFYSKKKLFPNFFLLLKNLLKSIFKIYLKINFGNSKKVFVFLNPSISLLKIFKLKLKLKSSIYLEPNFPKLEQYNYNSKLRSWNISEEIKDSMEEKLIKKLIPIFIPKSFIEGFPQIISNYYKNHLKIESKIIFTSSCHYTGFDVKKIWIALQKENGSKLIIGQHGGSLHKFNINTDFEREIGDKVLVHGSELFNNKKSENIGQFWQRINKNNYSKKGNGLLITFVMPRFATEPRCMPIASQISKYFKEQYDFYDKLLPKIKKQFKVRIYSKGDYQWKQEERWIERFPHINIDRGKNCLSDTISNSRLIISTYNGSTYQETLSANIPTIIFWNKKLFEIPSSAKNDFKRLEEVGIFHTNPSSAAEFLNQIWDEIENWWHSKNLQLCRKEFCKKYCDSETNIIKNLSNALIL